MPNPLVGVVAFPERATHRSPMIDAHLPTVRSSVSALRPHWKGHLLRFDPRPPLVYDRSSGLQLLLIVLIVEGIIGPRLGFLRWLGLPVPPAWLRVPLLLGVVLALTTWLARVRPAHLGLRSWTRWSKTEKSYFIQVLLLASIAFGSIFSERLRVVSETRSLWAAALAALTTSLLWGLYQELIYRGILQTELVRRWGRFIGILAANVLYTFGPLHLYHLSRGSALATSAMLAGIFAVGLFFGVLFKRSGNLWIVGIFHGLGNWYSVGLTTLVE